MEKSFHQNWRKGAGTTLVEGGVNSRIGAPLTSPNMI